MTAHVPSHCTGWRSTARTPRANAGSTRRVSSRTIRIRAASRARSASSTPRNANAAPARPFTRRAGSHADSDARRESATNGAAKRPAEDEGQRRRHDARAQETAEEAEGAAAEAVAERARVVARQHLEDAAGRERAREQPEPDGTEGRESEPLQQTRAHLDEVGEDAEAEAVGEHVGVGQRADRRGERHPRRHADGRRDHEAAQPQQRGELLVAEREAEAVSRRLEHHGLRSPPAPAPAGARR